MKRERKTTMTKSNTNERSSVAFLLSGLLSALLLAHTLTSHQTLAQGTKGGSSSASVFSSSSSTNQQQQQQQQQQLPINTAGQLSSTFVQMFNSLTPAQQQQFIRQMSSSNRRVFQQAVQVQPVQTSGFLTEEANSSSTSSSPVSSVEFSTGTSVATNNLGTKTAFARQQQFVSPVQQAAFFSAKKEQSSSFVQAQPQPQQQQQFSFSRQVSQSNTQTAPQQITVPAQTKEQTSVKRTVQSTVVQPQPQAQQQTSFFNQVQRVQQVAQPVVLPTTEQSFRRVQSFSSQPLVVAPQPESGFSQLIQQTSSSSVQPQPQPQTQQSTASLNRFQQATYQQTPSIPVTTQFTNSASGQLTETASPFQLQQEKLDTNSLGVSNNFVESAGFSQQQQSQPSVSTSSASVEQSSNSVVGGTSFDSSDGQQKNVAIGDEIYGGLTAASINNKWYIMRPVENPSALGLGDARAAQGSVRQLSFSGNGLALAELARPLGQTRAAVSSGSGSIGQSGSSNSNPTSSSSADSTSSVTSSAQVDSSSSDM